MGRKPDSDQGAAIGRTHRRDSGLFTENPVVNGAPAIAFAGATAIFRAALRFPSVFDRLETQPKMYFINPAYAQTGGQPDLFVQLAPFIIILVIMYFLILRPQQKRAKAHREMIANVRRGDTVITSGGFIGKVTKVIDDHELEVEIAPDTRVRVVRGMLTEVRAKGEPARE